LDHEGPSPGSQLYNTTDGPSWLEIRSFVKLNYNTSAFSYTNNNNIYLLQLSCNPVAVVILHVYKTWLVSIVTAVSQCTI